MNVFVDFNRFPILDAYQHLNLGCRGNQEGVGINVAREPFGPGNFDRLNGIAAFSRLEINYFEPNEPPLWNENFVLYILSLLYFSIIKKEGKQFTFY